MSGEFGFEVPLHASLANPVELGGAPRSIAIVNTTLAAIICLGLQQPLIGAPMAVAAHLVASFAFRRDAYLHLLLARHLAMKPFLDA